MSIPKKTLRTYRRELSQLIVRLSDRCNVIVDRRLTPEEVHNMKEWWPTVKADELKRLRAAIKRLDGYCEDLDDTEYLIEKAKHGLLQ